MLSIFRNKIGNTLWATAKSINQNVLKLKYLDILASNSTTELKHRELSEKKIQKSYIFNKKQYFTEFITTCQDHSHINKSSEQSST